MLTALLALVLTAEAGPPKPTRVPGAPRPPTTRTTVESHITAMGEAGIQRGYERLRAGQYALAEDRFRVELEADATSVPAQRGLALSAAGRRDCERAFPQLAALRSASQWDVDLAVAEGNCGMRSGDESRAVAAFQEAVLLDPTDADAWFGLAMALHQTGDDAGAEEAIDGLVDTTWKSPRAHVMAADVRAWIARDRGGDEAWDGLQDLRDAVRESRGESRAASVDADTIEGELWLELGDPLAAERSFGNGAAKALRAPRVGAERAEATRRIGDLLEAERLLTEGRAKRGEHLIKDVVSVRVHIDQGKLDDAEKALALLPANDTDVAATWWYLHRAQGASDAVLALDERRWRDTAPTAQASLLQLIPWNSK